MNAVLAATLLAAPPVYVDVDAPSVAEERDLERWLALRLAEEGHATTLQPREAGVRLRLLVRPDEVWIEADGAAPFAERVDLDGDELAGGEVGRLEVLHRALEAIERAQGGAAEATEDAEHVDEALTIAEPAPVPATPEPAAPAAIPTPVPSAPAPRSAPPRAKRTLPPALAGPFEARVGARLGFLARNATIDPLVAANLRLGRAPGFGARADVQVWPGTDPSPRVVEVVLAVGPSLRVRASRRLHVDLALVGGALVHTWWLAPARGVAADATFELSSTFDVAFGRGLALSLVPFVGVATRSRVHEAAGEVVWSRGAWRVGLALGLSWGRGRKA